jgi:molecular chaperone HtpG
VVAEETNSLKTSFEAEQPKDEKATYTIEFAALGAQAQPVTITQSEFMRRMKEMAAVGGGGMNFYGQMPDAYTLVVNTDHALVNEVLTKSKANDETAATLSKQLIDLALLSNGMLKGEALNAFVKRSIDLIR